MTGGHRRDDGESEFRVTDLAALCGLSVRVIRAHQSRRLLHPPRRVGRHSVYDQSHVDRLRLIQRLQAAGFSLAAIRALLQSGHDAPELALAWHAEGLAMRFPPSADADDPELEVEPAGLAALHSQPGALEALESYGLVRRRSNTSWQGTHPVLVDVGRRARELGVPSSEVTRVQLRVAAATLELSRELVDTFRIQVDRHRQPATNETEPDRAQLIEDYARISALATALVNATFEVQLARVVRTAVGIRQPPG